jgi:Xaa-Pro dipeptidase
MENAARRGGGDGMVWPRRWDSYLPAGGIVASGPNAWVVSGEAMTVTGVGLSPALPWGPSSRRLEPGDLVVVDFTLSYEGYHCDMTRTYCVGSPNQEQRDLWERLLELHLQVVDRVRPGVTGEELYLVAKALAEDMGLIDNFMGVGSERGSYIGHSIGLELDEWPVLGAGYREPLPVGAVITIEPKIMIPGKGAVMVEDDIVVTPSGHEVISTLERVLFVP